MQNSSLNNGIPKLANEVDCKPRMKEYNNHLAALQGCMDRLGVDLVHCAINTRLVSILPKVFQACHNNVYHNSTPMAQEEL